MLDLWDAHLGAGGACRIFWRDGPQTMSLAGVTAANAKNPFLPGSALCCGRHYSLPSTFKHSRPNGMRFAASSSPAMSMFNPNG